MCTSIDRHANRSKKKKRPFFGVHFNDDIATLIRSFIAPAEIYVPSVTMPYFPVYRETRAIDTRNVSEVAHFLRAIDIESQTHGISAGHLIHPI